MLNYLRKYKFEKHKKELKKCYGGFYYLVMIGELELYNRTEFTKDEIKSLLNSNKKYFR